MEETTDDPFQGPAWLANPDDAVNCRLADVQPMTKFERAMLIGIRAMQLAQGSRPRAVATSDNPLDVAEAELVARTLPDFVVVRHLPDGSDVHKLVADLDTLPACVDT